MRWVVVFLFITTVCIVIGGQIHWQKQIEWQQAQANTYFENQKAAMANDNDINKKLDEKESRKPLITLLDPYRSEFHQFAEKFESRIHDLVEDSKVMYVNQVIRNGHSFSELVSDIVDELNEIEQEFDIIYEKDQERLRAELITNRYSIYEQLEFELSYDHLKEKMRLYVLNEIFTLHSARQ